MAIYFSEFPNHIIVLDQALEIGSLGWTYTAMNINMQPCLEIFKTNLSKIEMMKWEDIYWNLFEESSV